MSLRIYLVSVLIFSCNVRRFGMLFRVEVGDPSWWPELDKIFNNKAEKKLEENEYYPQMPPQLRALRSVLLFRVDNHIFENSRD